MITPKLVLLLVNPISLLMFIYLVFFPYDIKAKDEPLRQWALELLLVNFIGSLIVIGVLLVTGKSL